METDDLRESPSVTLCNYLINEGIDVSIYDSNLDFSKLLGKNKILLDTKDSRLKEVISTDLDSFLEKMIF